MTDPHRERVLVATDLSEPADEAIRQAHQWATATGGELVVCHVVPTSLHANVLFPQDNEGNAFATVEWEKWAGEQVESRVVELTGRDPDSFKVTVDSGIPEAVIVGEAEETSADLVVIGNRGATGIERLPIGTIAARVLRLAHCSVLVARPHPRTGRVLAATDLSDPSLPAVVSGAAEAKRRGARLTVLHNVDTAPPVLPPLEMTVSPSVFTPGAFAAIGAVLPPEIVKRAEDHVRELMTSHGIVGDCRVTDGDPAAQVYRVAQELDAELLVIGTHGRTGLARLALGSTAERLVATAACSVLVVRLAPGTG
jgi:nucleotide-binding universal stress UspA family protein